LRRMRSAVPTRKRSPPLKSRSYRR
jgi:hypothetical protein